MTTEFIKNLSRATESALAVRDSIGAIIQPVFQVTRTWNGSEPGEGRATEQEVQVLPTPGMREYSQDVRLREGGNIKAGDIILTGFTKEKYTKESLDSVTDKKNVEKFFAIGGKIYQVINITEKLVTLNVQVRELTNQTRYRNG